MPDLFKSISEGQLFVTIPNVKSEGFGETSLCREYTLPREDQRTRREGFTQGNSRTSPVLDLLVTKHLITMIDDEINFLVNNGTQSEVVVSRVHVTQHAQKWQLLHTELSTSGFALGPPQVSSLVPATASETFQSAMLVKHP